MKLASSQEKPGDVVTIIDPDFSAATLLNAVLSRKFQAAGIPWGQNDTTEVMRVFEYVKDTATDAAVDLVMNGIDLEEDGVIHVVTFHASNAKLPALGKA